MDSRRSGHSRCIVRRGTGNDNTNGREDHRDDGSGYCQQLRSLRLAFDWASLHGASPSRAETRRLMRRIELLALGAEKLGRCPMGWLLAVANPS